MMRQLSQIFLLMTMLMSLSGCGKTPADPPLHQPDNLNPETYNILSALFDSLDPDILRILLNQKTDTLLNGRSAFYMWDDTLIPDNTIITESIHLNQRSWYLAPKFTATAQVVLIGKKTGSYEELQQMFDEFNVHEILSTGLPYIYDEGKKALFAFHAYSGPLAATWYLVIAEKKGTLWKSKKIYITAIS